MPDVFNTQGLDEIAKKYQANPLGAPALPETPDNPIFDTSRLDEIAKRYAPAKPKAQPVSGITRDRERYIPPGAENWSINNFDQIGSRYRQQFGQAIPTRAFGQGNIHNSQHWDHRNAVDVPVDPNSERGKWILNDLRTNNVPFQAMYRAIKNPTTGRISSTGPHIHIGLPSHSTNERFPVGTRQGPQTSPTFAEPKLDIGRLNEIAAKYKAPVPEHPETLTAQAQSAARPDSPKLGILVTPGATPPSIPSGFTMVETPKGKLYFDPAKVKAAGITDPIAEMDRILGTVEPVADTSQGNAVVARDPVTGRELEAKIVTTPETAQAQAKVNARMHPDSVQSVEPAQSVVARRQQARKVPIRRVAPAQPNDIRRFPGGPVQPKRVGVRVGQTADETPEQTYLKALDTQRRGYAQHLMDYGVNAQDAATRARLAQEKGMLAPIERTGDLMTDAVMLGNEAQRERNRGNAQFEQQANAVAPLREQHRANVERQKFLKSLTPAERQEMQSDVGRLVNNSDVVGGAQQGLSRSIASTDLDAAAILAPLGALIGNDDIGGARRKAQIRLETIQQALEQMPTEKRESVIRSIAETVASTPLDLARLAALSKLPGGAVTGFAADAALQGIGERKPVKDIARQTAAGAGTGALFGALHGLPLVQRALGAGIGSQIIGGAMGEDPSLQGAVLNAAFASLPAGKGEARPDERVPEARQPVENLTPENPVLAEQIPANAKNAPNLSRGVSMDEVRRANPAPEQPAAESARESVPTVAPKPVEAARPKEAAPVATPEPAPERVTPKLVEPETKATEPDARFSANKIFTADKVAEARARISAKAKGNQLNVGLDPELAKDYAVVGAAHIEAGARRFGEWSKQMVSDFGDEIKPHLDKIYKASRDAHDFEQEPVIPESKGRKTPVGIREHGETMRQAGLTEAPDVEYDPQTVPGWKKDAVATIDELGVDKAIQHYKDLPDGDQGGKYSLGDALLDRLKPGTEEYSDVARHQIEHAGEAGQTLRAAAEVSRRDPANAVKYTEMALQRIRKRGLTPEEATRVQERADRQIAVEKEASRLDAELDRIAKAEPSRPTEGPTEAPTKEGKQRPSSTREPKAPKVTYEVKIRTQGDAALATLRTKLKAGKLDLGTAPKVGERGAVRVEVGEIPELKGDAELIAQYAASRLPKLESIDALNKELVKEFGPEIEPHLKDIRQRALSIRAEIRRAEIAEADKPRQQTLIGEIRKELQAAHREVKQAENAELVAKREAQAAERAEKAQGRYTAGVQDRTDILRTRSEMRQAKVEALRQQRELAEAAREQKAQLQRELSEARKTEVKGYRQQIGAERTARKAAGRWDVAMRQVATEARERLPETVDSKDPAQMEDLVSVGTEKFLNDSSLPTITAISPARFYREMAAEFPKLTTRQIGKIYRRSLENARDATKAAREVAQLRGATKESQARWEKFWDGSGIDGEDISAQAILIQRAQKAKELLKLRTEQQQELNRLSRSTAGVIWDDWIHGPTKSLRSTIDSMLGRQGLQFAVLHPIITAKNALPGTRGYVMSRGEFERAMRTVENHPRRDMAEAMGVDLPAVEEQFQHNIASNLPHVRLSEQAATLQMTGQRLGMVDYFARLGEAAGYTPENNPHYYKEAGRAINIGTGRGDLDPTTVRGRVATASNRILFSGKLAASRFQLINDVLNPVSWAKNDPVIRKYKAVQLLKLGVVSLGVVGAAKALGLPVGTNPFEKDFGKLRVGNSRYDLLAGNGAPVRLIAALSLMAYQKSTGQKLPYGQDNPWNMLGQQLRYKLGPVPGLAYDTTFGGQKNPVGEPVQYIPDPHDIQGTLQRNALVNLVSPMVMGDFVDGWADDGLRGMLKTVPALGGLGVNTYADKPAKGAKPGTTRHGTPHTTTTRSGSTPRGSQVHVPQH